jgi:hypothetical protein
MTAPTAFTLTMQALHLVERMYGDEGVDPAEIDTWCGEGDAAVERRRFVARRLELELTAAKHEAARFTAYAKRLEQDIERMEQATLALLEAKEQLGLEPKVKTANVNARLQKTVAVVGPEDPTLWPQAFRRVKTTESPDKANAKVVLKAFLDAWNAAEEKGEVLPVPPEVAELHAAGVGLEFHTSLVWK